MVFVPAVVTPLVAGPRHEASAVARLDQKVVVGVTRLAHQVEAHGGVAVDENAIDDRKLVSHFQELCKQQNPGSVHFELKQVKEEMRESIEMIATLKGKIHAQSQELKLLRGTGAKGFSSRWGKLKSAVMLGNAKTKNSKSKRRKGKKGKRRTKR